VKLLAQIARRGRDEHAYRRWQAQHAASPSVATTRRSSSPSNPGPTRTTAPPTTTSSPLAVAGFAVTRTGANVTGWAVADDRRLPDPLGRGHRPVPRAGVAVAAARHRRPRTCRVRDRAA